jgi:hypothetical protein
MRLNVRRECAGEGRDGLVDLSPKGVSKVRLLRGATLMTCTFVLVPVRGEWSLACLGPVALS